MAPASDVNPAGRNIRIRLADIFNHKTEEWQKGSDACGADIFNLKAFPVKRPNQRRFHGMRESRMPSPQNPVMPAKMRPAPTKAESQYMGCQT